MALSEENPLQYVRRRLAELNGHRTQISIKAGVSYGSVAKLHGGHKKQPSWDIVWRLYETIKREYPEHVSSPTG